jgi:hypothetical protein
MERVGAREGDDACGVWNKPGLESASSSLALLKFGGHYGSGISLQVFHVIFIFNMTGSCIAASNPSGVRM